MLPFFVLVPLLALLYLRVQRRRAAAAERVGSLAVARDERGRSMGRIRHVPAIILMAGVTVMLCALARPEATVSVPKREGTVVLAFDVSASMSAEDIEPTRMEAAKAVALEFVSRQPATVAIGVVAFGDGGLSVQVPTTDREDVAAAIRRLSPQGGTSVGQGILASLNSISIAEGQAPLFGAGGTPLPTSPAIPAGTNRSAAIVLLTDGENRAAPDPLLAAQAAADRGVRIHAIGVGSPTGAVIQVDGFAVHTQTDEPLLREIARITDGAYYNAQSEEDLRDIYLSIEPELRIEPEQMEITSFFAVAGLAFLMAGTMLSLRWLWRAP